MKNKWNFIVFLVYLIYCLFFFVVFWCVFDDNQLYRQYFDLSYTCLLVACGTNTVSQIIAIITKKKYAVRWIVLGAFALLMTIAFTIGQSV